jgi:hypothetical protein
MRSNFEFITPESITTGEAATVVKTWFDYAIWFAASVAIGVVAFCASWLVFALLFGFMWAEILTWSLFVYGILRQHKDSFSRAQDCFVGPVTAGGIATKNGIVFAASWAAAKVKAAFTPETIAELSERQAAERREAAVKATKRATKRFKDGLGGLDGVAQ